MTTDLILYAAARSLSQERYNTRPIPAAPNEPGTVGQMPLEILFITTYPPRECGIATYSHDLTAAIHRQFAHSFTCTICALESDAEQHIYPAAPKYILHTDRQHAFRDTANLINGDEQVKLVVLQHEFGFFHRHEKEFSAFIDALDKPLILVFHTVLPAPDDTLRSGVQAMTSAAAAVIVMTAHAKHILTDSYSVQPAKIQVIAHGTHLVPSLDRKKEKAHYDLTGRKVLSTFGLLGPSKSIETTLNALPAVIETHPEVLFLVLGKTHPNLVKQDGEIYRQSLEQQVKTLHLEQHVRFVNAYLELPILLTYLQLTDIYLFTSKDPNQAVSGTFSYAVSSGCPVISTPIPHAKEVLGDNNGIIIDFENPAQLTTAIISLLDNESLRAALSSRSFHRMASTAWQNSAIAHASLFAQILSPHAMALQYSLPPIKLDHVKKLTTQFGMIQFAKIAMPDIHTGYTLDDNARAMIAMCQHLALFRQEDNLLYIQTYLEFIKHCMQRNGQFMNYADDRKQFTTQNFAENLDDSTGRAIWALGYVVSMKDVLPAHFATEADIILQKALTHLAHIHSTRAMAFIIKGLHYQNNPDNMPLLEKLAMRMVQMYRHEKTADWHWFETYLTYGNSLLPEALLCAYISTKDTVYKQVACESFTFLLSKIFVGNSLKVISNKGWHIKDKEAEQVVGGEQPIDVAYTVMALARFYDVLGKDVYKEQVIRSFNWFLGDNHLQQVVYNPCTGGCYDGVEEYNVNLNQGAESTVSYLMARLTMEALLRNNSPGQA